MSFAPKTIDRGRSPDANISGYVRVSDIKNYNPYTLNPEYIFVEDSVRGRKLAVQYPLYTVIMSNGGSLASCNAINQSEIWEE